MLYGYISGVVTGAGIQKATIIVAFSVSVHGQQDVGNDIILFFLRTGGLRAQLRNTVLLIRIDLNLKGS